MGIICKKCNYERKPEELVSEQECPNCGVFYFKYDAWLQKQAAKHGVSEPQILDPVQAKAKAYIEKAAQRREQTTPDAKPSVREKTVRPTTSIATPQKTYIGQLYTKHLNKHLEQAKNEFIGTHEQLLGFFHVGEILGETLGGVLSEILGGVLNVSRTNGNDNFLIVTNERIIVWSITLGLFVPGSNTTVFHYNDITSVEEIKKWLLGEIVLNVSGTKIHLQNMAKQDVAVAVAMIRNLVASNRTTNTERLLTNAPIGNLQDIPDQLKKWAELRDTGVITDSEFTKKKNELLSNPDTTVLTPSPLSRSFKPSSQIYGPVIKEAIPIPPPTGWQIMWKRIGVALFLIGLILSSAPKSSSAIGYGTLSMWIGFALAFPGNGLIRIGGGLILAGGITAFIHSPSAPNYSRKISPVETSCEEAKRKLQVCKILTGDAVVDCLADLHVPSGCYLDF